ncbi:MAG: di-trans,poly-cis-decaprenylcistransferase [Treponema sp.]|nr:di-trans,poly-cis-decaprenylcistransferase [Treponema sp.]
MNDSSVNTAVPVHLGIIMDGNGRWAKSRGQSRPQGHLEGLKAAKRIVKAASDRGISYLTLYTFSTENWKRDVEEVNFIMSLVRRHLRGELNFYRENGIRIRHAGDSSRLPQDIAAELRRACEDTRDFKGTQVVLALNYGGRDEIVRAVNRALAAAGPVPADDKTGFTETMLRSCLDNPDVPDPDLIIRTAGEFRVSNFLLWEAAYAEYYISGKFWPDFSEEDLETALACYAARDRRYGGLHDGEGGPAA